MTRIKKDYSSTHATLRYGLYEITVSKQELEELLSNMKDLEVLEGIVSRAEQTFEANKIKNNIK